ncbi:helix-turn-helix domain-containing protein [Paenibacillus timonensis]|uniref:Helix-turn-helix domain-containing protein n=1 Tax=Paenibacillus timonensis TaxID=225915 RepID=A0ABW3SHF5_9BACL|nr:helix-turn-helix domain-containing protein [Paenibacillus timonensis]MCH1642009.1 helix-turn-helix domain-containing protein [Paenibacillus timonensis]
MLQVLLVDDEPWVLEGLRTMVNWEKHGFQVCGEALDGPEALVKMQEFRPELVVTDIHMPVISGLELIERSKRLLGKPPKFVILSGYDDFNYALTAMRQRVAEYLLKPIDEDEFEVILERLGQTIAEEREMERSSSRKQSLFKNNILNRLIQGEEGVRLEQEAATALQLEGEPELQCMLIDAGAYLPDLKQRVLGFFSQNTDRAFLDGLGRVGVIVRTDELPQPRVEEIGLAISSGLSNPESPVIIAVSGAGKGIRSIRELYLQTLETVKAKREQGKTGLFLPCHYPQSSKAEDLLKGKFEQLLDAVLEGEPDAAEAAVDEVFGTLACSQTGVEALRAFAANMELTLCRKIKKAGGDPDAFMVRMQADAGGPNGLSGYPALKHQLLRLCREAALLLAGLRRKNENNTMFQVIQYVDEEFRSKLKLQTLAKKFHMNPTYLGQVFKKETGKAFNEYLNEKRIEEAKRLLKRTPMKISDIALQVGYPNTDYFISKFKQATGLLPSVYKSESANDVSRHEAGPKPAE